MMFHLGRSFWRVPRSTLHLQRLWKRTPPAASGGI
jgi:hypothetical protein